MDHRIVEAVNAWSQTSEAGARQTAWCVVVDLMNRKVWEMQLALMPQRTREDPQTPNAPTSPRSGASGHLAADVERPTLNAQCKIIEASQPPY
jgi:hypothetical protein